MAEVAFIGLGNMGLPMASNLAAAGHTVRVYDTVAEAIVKAVAAGMQPSSSAAKAVSGADFIITMLPNGPIALAVLAEILPSAMRGAVVIDCSTIDVASAREAHRIAGEAGLLPLDAPVSGGTGGAAAGTLTFMVGGAKDAFDKALPLFEVMGGKTVHCGDGGSGQAAKICNNMLLGISMIGACEAFSLAEKLGLSAQAAFDVISTSSGSCWSVNTYCPVPGVGPKSPADNDYKPGFAAELMAKDLGLSQEAAANAGHATPLGAHALALYRSFLEKNGAGRDFSAIIDYLRTAKRSEA
ncbi:3-hydroxyisobutyrate dehydrogenase [Rhizobium halophytocola]|uniref:3-hydroxyisobutyrate dehydrogenase n=1 Tax=Rhizobium halophytocola TaxID=735519 RepID=A0ABS4DV35_9HYPH|nr:3-hydroxyisobutyrate dehydrogenase [Rhizobium halophytocola]MBP1849553.1 3-hydroxyisobutyrate dehydrogenase [Rhizobium halophytocola]